MEEVEVFTYKITDLCDCECYLAGFELKFMKYPLQKTTAIKKKSKNDNNT